MAHEKEKKDSISSRQSFAGNVILEYDLDVKISEVNLKVDCLTYEPITLTSTLWLYTSLG